MGAANLTVHEQCGSVGTVSGNTPLTQANPEKASQTFLQGVPVQLNAGYVQKWDGATYNAGILGFSLMPGSNLSSNGKGSPGNFSQVGPPGSSVVYGSVPYQTAAYNIPIDGPMTDGRTLYEAAISDTVFEAQFDNSNGTVASDYTPTVADIGVLYGLTFDASGYIYVDANKTTVGTNTSVQIVSINPIDLVQAGTPNTYIVNARVRFVVVPAAQQIAV
jgi:hypothetical protein